jgi:lathosterol oxidase
MPPSLQFNSYQGMAALAQLVEHRIRNAGVTGSSPVSGTSRLMHRPWFFNRAHAVHHASRPPTAWAAMSFHPWEALTGAIVIPALVFFIPIHVAALAVVLSVMTLMGVTNHMGWELFPRIIVRGVLGNWLITATHHQRHHDEYRGNYGLYFRVWDKLCGTDRGLGTFADRDSRSGGTVQP